MATVQWPAELPNCADTWRERDRETLIRTPMETGPPKVRRRFTSPIREFDVGMVMRHDQFADLRDFYDISCAQGVVKHYFRHPYLNLVQEFRFMAPPELASSGPLAVVVAMKWEQFAGM